MAGQVNRLGIVGTGVMGAGIAQIAAQAGLEVALFDKRDGAASAAREGRRDRHEMPQERERQ